MNSEHSDRTDERHSELDPSFEKLIELSRRDFDSIPVPPFDAEAFLQAVTPRVERDLEKRRRRKELIDLSRADLDTIPVPDINFAELVRQWTIEGEMRHRLQHIQNQLDALASKRSTASMHTEDFVTGCEDVLDSTIAVWRDTPDEHRVMLLAVSEEVREVAEDFVYYAPIKDRLEQLEGYMTKDEGFMTKEQATDVVVELRTHLRSTYLL